MPLDILLEILQFELQSDWSRRLRWAKLGSFPPTVFWKSLWRRSFWVLGLICYFICEDAIQEGFRLVHCYLKAGELYNIREDSTDFIVAWLTTRSSKVANGVPTGTPWIQKS